MATRDCGCIDLDENIGSCYCALEPLVVAVGRRHALQVLNVIAAREGAHFNEIQAQLGNLSSSTLAARLQELEDVELVRRESERSDPPRWAYTLTVKGTALRDSLRKLFRGDDPFQTQQ